MTLRAFVLISAGAFVSAGLLGSCQSAPPTPEAGAGSAATAASGAVAKPSAGEPYVCPVMGGTVDVAAADKDPELHCDHEGTRYYFCCPGCKSKFEEDPEKWIAKAAASSE